MSNISCWQPLTLTTQFFKSPPITRVLFEWPFPISEVRSNVYVAKSWRTLARNITTLIPRSHSIKPSQNQNLWKKISGHHSWEATIKCRGNYSYFFFLHSSVRHQLQFNFIGNLVNWEYLEANLASVFLYWLSAHVIFPFTMYSAILLWSLTFIYSGYTWGHIQMPIIWTFWGYNYFHYKAKALWQEHHNTNSKSFLTSLRTEQSGRSPFFKVTIKCWGKYLFLNLHITLTTASI